MKLGLVLLLSGMVVIDASAAIFQCVVGDKTVFQELPCPEGSGQERVSDGEIKAENSIVYQPFRHVGEPISLVANRYGLWTNEAGNLVHMDDGIEILLESQQEIVSYAEVRFGLYTCKQEPLSHRDAAQYLKLIGIEVGELVLREPAGQPAYIRSYDDLEHKLKVSVYCPYDGGEWSIGFSRAGHNAG